MRILVIEDDETSARAMESLFKSEGWVVDTTDLGEEGVSLAKIYDYDLITLDLDLPDMFGFEALVQMRTAKVTTPVLIVTAHADIETKVRSLGAGADGFLVKPVRNAELIAHVHAIVRRAAGHPASILELGGVELNLDAKKVRVGGKPVHLTGKEYQMLELMMLRKGSVLSKDNFLNHLYGGRDEPEVKIIDVFICKLRKKLTDAGAGKLVETVWGRGYRISTDHLAVAT